MAGAAGCAVLHARNAVWVAWRIGLGHLMKFSSSEMHDVSWTSSGSKEKPVLETKVTVQLIWFDSGMGPFIHHRGQISNEARTH